MVGCDLCGTLWKENELVDNLCPDCLNERYDHDDNLRDEVAKAVLPEMARQQNNWKSGVMLAFEWADAFMSERARRREGR